MFEVRLSKLVRTLAIEVDVESFRRYNVFLANKHVPYGDFFIL
jgi:hypothetical protein